MIDSKINNSVLCCFDSWVLSTGIMLTVFVWGEDVSVLWLDV